MNKDILHMKSVIVQGASVAKAIDEALQKAGMPQEFFVKILEEAQPGFLGFGSKKAKIALFFKKEDSRKNGSLLSLGTYKDLFENQGLLAQAEMQEKQLPRESRPHVKPSDNKQETKQEIKPRPQQPQQKKSQPRHGGQHQPITPQSKNSNQAAGSKPINHPKPAQQNNVSMQQRKLVDPLQQKKESVQSGGESISIDDKAVQVQSQNSGRPRRRRSYGYRSRGPVQWGKSSDEPDHGTDIKTPQNSNNEPKDSESK